MLLVMRHRCPDGLKVVERDGYSIGMGRLAVIDLTSKNLFPLVDDKTILTFNGEIYNFIELRENLKKIGYVFVTNSDTEVLLRMWQHHREYCLRHLNGMYAFCVYEPQEQKLFLARDIAGEKPLYYRKDKKGFYFASEAKALNWECEEMPPGSAFTVNLKKNEIQNHAQHKIGNYIFSSHLTREQELELLLEDSVRLRTRSDVPYGLYYSGGIDSSLLATFHRFSKLFSYVDSSLYKEDFKKNLRKIVWHLDYPVKSFSAYALWRLAREASQSVKVVISGEGADELFGGYVRYVQPHFNAEAQKRFPSYQTMFQPAQNVNDAGVKEFYGNMQELLRMGDRMASAWGIENRCPFLDGRIIDFAFSLPPEEKIDGLTTKKILRKVLLKRFPAYQEFEKAGLYASVNQWLGVENKYDKKVWVETQEKICQSFKEASR